MGTVHSLENDIDEQRPPTKHPSLENRCFAEPAPSERSLLLGDQATYCLSNGHEECPRYQRVLLSLGSTAQDPFVDGDRTTSLALDSDLLYEEVDQPLLDEFSDDEEEAEQRRQSFVWMASGGAFLLVFICGILFALVAGWQMVSENLLAATGPGQSQTITGTTLGQVASPTGASVIVVITATSQPAGSAPEQGAAQNPSAINGRPASTEAISFDFPVAVTPTPIVIDPNAARVDESAAQGDAQDTAAVEAVALPPSTPVPEIDVNSIVPTVPPRRATPTFWLCRPLHHSKRQPRRLYRQQHGRLRLLSLPPTKHRFSLANARPSAGLSRM